MVASRTANTIHIHVACPCTPRDLIHQEIAFAIAQITSATKIRVNPDGARVVVNDPACVLLAEPIGRARTPHIRMQARVWNPTIANLSLMALGSSAPEILLSVIEVSC